MSILWYLYAMPMAWSTALGSKQYYTSIIWTYQLTTDSWMSWKQTQYTITTLNLANNLTIYFIPESRIPTEHLHWIRHHGSYQNSRWSPILSIKISADSKKMGLVAILGVLVMNCSCRYYHLDELGLQLDVSQLLHVWEVCERWQGLCPLSFESEA